MVRLNDDIVLVGANRALCETEIFHFQQAWGESLIRIGELYVENGDYYARARRHIDRFYAYDSGQVLFKPTFAVNPGFRLTREGALAYFVGNSSDYPDDTGFALKPWKSVEWRNAGVTILKGIALAMGTYYFTPVEGQTVAVNFSIGCIRSADGLLRMVLHDSHLP